MKYGRLFSVACAFAVLAALAGACVNSTVTPAPIYDPDRIIDAGSAVKKDAGINATVAAYNVEGFDLGGATPGGTYAGIAKALKNASVEIVAFEEVQPEDIAALKQALGSNACAMPYLVCSGKSDGYNSFAVASAYPILSANEVVLPSGAIWPRSIFQVTIDIGKGLTLYVCHLKSGSDSASLAKRKAQAAALASYLRDTGDALKTEYIVLLGDMNTMSEGDRTGVSNTLSLLELEDDADSSNDFTSMTEAFLAPGTAYTWQGSVGGVFTQSALDHLVLSKSARSRFVPGSLKIWRTDPSVTMTANSDHFPVLLDISL